MSKMVQAVKEKRADEVNKPVVNFMGGISYEINPLDTLKMVSASSIFGEPQYYRDGEFVQASVKDGRYFCHELFNDYSLLDFHYLGMKTSAVMEEVIDKALDYDFEETLKWAVTLRHDFYMRLNPQIIMVRAAMHSFRQAFNQAHPGLFSAYQKQVMQRGDEPASQLAYYLYRYGSKKNLPSILKRSWAKKIESLDRYELHKYKNAGIGLIDTIRICHGHNDAIDELMQSGTIKVTEDKNNWETLRAQGKSWQQIIDKIKLGHMALLRNLRGIFSEIDDLETCQRLMQLLKAGVINGKQFPFRYYAALRAIETSDVYHKALIMDNLEEGIDISCETLPHLKGRTICLSDNSGSAWSTCSSEYGTVTIASIDNLSSLITAHNSDEGYVGLFGDKLDIYPVLQHNGLLSQALSLDDKGQEVGYATENGIWLFFDQAICQKQHWDNIFIYSDMQAGHGGLYGLDECIDDYRQKGYLVGSRYIDVAKMIERYRRLVNPKVNVFSIQTAGYTNIVVPEQGYRTSLLYGWSGKELNFARTMIDFWDEKDKVGRSSK